MLHLKSEAPSVCSMATQKDGSGEEALPIPPLDVKPSHIVPDRVSQKPQKAMRTPMARPGFGSDGARIQLLSNHFSVRLSSNDAIFYQYSVSIKSEDKRAVESKGMGRKIIEKLHQTYSSELAGKQFAYDGEKSLFTLGPLPQNNFEFTVILEESSARSAGGSPIEGDRKRLKHSQLAKTFKVEISYAAKIPLKSITLAIRGSEPEHTQDALRVLDITLRQQQAKRGCLLVRQSFFNGDHTNFVDLGGGVSGCRGFHSSFHTTLGGLMLNMDVSTTMIMTPGPVIDFLLANQNVKDPKQIDWIKAKRMLKNMRIKTNHNGMEFKIIGLSELPCRQQVFPMKIRDGSGEGQTVEITVSEYFKSTRRIELSWSANMPCLDVGKPKRPNYLPIELCNLVSLQRYTKALSSQQRASLVEKSRQKPQDRIRVVTDAVRSNRYDDDPILSTCGIHIEKQLTRVEGRVLTAPMLKVGNKEDCIPRNGRWNFNNKRLWAPVKIEKWAIVNFSARCDMSHLSRELINCGRNKGIHIERPFTLIDEDRQWLRSGPVVRVERMYEKIRLQLPGPPQFLLCVLPERKNSEIYGPWKKKNLHEVGIITQCISPTRINDQYLSNLLLKINSKVVGSRYWPLISRYRASVRTQSPKVEMIDSLFKPQANGKDDGIMRELLVDFYQTSGSRKPSQIIIFRDGVSESQFSQVLNIELNQIRQAYEYMGESTTPKFTLIVGQKNHHTKLFRADAPDNVPPGTVVDTTIVHPRFYDFYMCAHAGIIGTSRPTHYHVLLDEIGFSTDDLQKLVHSLSYVYQRSTTAISIVAPIVYAHLAAQQMSQFIKFEELSETSSGHGSGSAAGQPAIPELPRLHDNVCSSMFFC